MAGADPFSWYNEAAYPSAVAHHLYQLGQIHGLAKIQYTLLSMASRELSLSPCADLCTQNLPDGIFEIMKGYVDYANAMHVEGYDF